ncbi:hypothetical protein ACFPMF_11195 [Larkinella bovis]|uniref:Uncharacterized protein n=1 Tax=Larkinella bovis TaxID=683041 RepID=A0ABW0IBZ4_9BACT
MSTLPQTDPITPNQIRNTLLHIILATSYIDKYAKDETKTHNEATEKETQPTGSTPQNPKLRGILNLRDALNEYNKLNNEGNNKGSSSFITSNLHVAQKKGAGVSKSIDTERLKKCYNQLIGKAIDNDVVENIFTALDRPTGASYTIEEKSKKIVSDFKPCIFLINEKFGRINPFTVTINQKSTLQAEEYHITYNNEGIQGPDTIEKFLHSNQELISWSISFNGLPLLPTNDYKSQKTSKTKKISGSTLLETSNNKKNVTGLVTSSFENIEIHKEIPLKPDHTDYCIAHYLNLDRQPTIAIVTLNWHGHTLLEAKMEQLQEFIRGRVPLAFDSLPAGGVIDGGKTVYVVLQERHSANNSQDVPFQMQISITKDEINGLRNGIYSSILYSQKRTSQVSSAVVLQTIKNAGNLEDIKQLGQNLSQYFKKGSRSDNNNSSIDEQILIATQDIRYRILGQMVNIQVLNDQTVEKQRNDFSQFIGHYICYYMRLAKWPVKLETSYIRIYADGTVLLRQPQDKNASDLNGFVRLRGSRLWIYLHHDLFDGSGREPIRFMIDSSSSGGSTTLKGIFSSETKQGNWLVSGRMLMKKISDFKEADFKIVEKDTTDVTIADFDHEDDLHFFTAEQPDGLIRTDGPFWAEIANRLQGPSAFDKLEELCTDKSLNTNPFNNNQFYYYTFKADPNDPKNREAFIIERNLVTFLPNGKVTIHTTNKKPYTGNAYFLNNTLRLSVSESNSGFFELFLDLRNDIVDLARIKILYGMSLWHSSIQIQGKMVVLSRFSGRPFIKEAKWYRFTPDQRQAIEEEDKKEGGVISYLRGEINRYMHATTDSSPQQFRPRDQSFREIHFLVACFYGYLMKASKDDKKLAYRTGENQIKLCQTHLKQAYIHGFACPFAGLNFDSDRVKFNPGEIAKAYSTALLSHLPDDNTRRAFLEEDGKTQEILKRVGQIAAEQRFLKQAFKSGGPLDNKELYDYAYRYWPNLLLNESPSSDTINDGILDSRS